MDTPLVRVVWLDSVLIDRYVPEADREPTITPITTVGFLVRETDDALLVARETHDGIWRGLILIPTFAIQSRTTLQEA
jgi:hypothetical protein